MHLDRSTELSRRRRRVRALDAIDQKSEPVTMF